MAEKTNQSCANCGAKGLLFCDNMFTDFFCTECGASNLTATLPRIETLISCVGDKKHDIRLARDNLLLCVICSAEFGKITVTRDCNG